MTILDAFHTDHESVSMHMHFTLKLNFGLIDRPGRIDKLRLLFRLCLVSESGLTSMLVPDCSAVLRGEGLVLILELFEVGQVET